MAILSLDAYPVPTHDFSRPVAKRSDLHRLFAAAIVSDQFREALLTEPEMALAGGYLGQTFALTDEERTIIKSVRAKNLTDFAQKVNQALKNEQQPIA